LLLSAFASHVSRVSPVQPAADPFLTPSQHFPLGTDDLGRDEWSRLMHGGRITLSTALVSAAVAVGLGLTAALLAQGIGGVADATLVGGSSAAMAIPGLLLALLLVAGMGPGLQAVTLAVGLGLAPGFARLARQALREVHTQLFVTAAAALGSSGMVTARRHLLPNALPRLLSLATTHFAWAVAGVTTLTFLGLSGDPSRPEWGAMLNAGRAYLRIAPGLALFPGAAILATILSVHSLGEAVARRARSPGRG
jgi:ABC-type dipeptide/oligopeptide/nickel transport system permease subunit